VKRMRSDPSVIQSARGAKPGRGTGRHIDIGFLRSPPLSHHILSKCGVDIKQLPLFDNVLRMSHPDLPLQSLPSC